MDIRRISSAVPYVVSVVGIAAALVVSVALRASLEDSPFAPFVVVVIAVSYYRRPWAPLTAIALSLVAVYGVLAVPLRPIRAAIFVLGTLLIVGLQAQLGGSEQRYRSLFERVPIGLYRLERGVVHANTALARICGFADAVALKSTPLGSLYADPRDRDRFREALHRGAGVVEDFAVPFSRDRKSTRLNSSHRL